MINENSARYAKVRVTTGSTRCQAWLRTTPPDQGPTPGVTSPPMGNRWGIPHRPVANNENRMRPSHHSGIEYSVIVDPVEIWSNLCPRFQAAMVPIQIPKMIDRIA